MIVSCKIIRHNKLLDVKPSILRLLDLEAEMYDKPKDKAEVTKAKIVDPKSTAKQAVSDDKDSEVNNTFFCIIKLANMLPSCIFSHLFKLHAHVQAVLYDCLQ